MTTLRTTLATLSILAFLGTHASADPGADFAQKVRPFLKNHCYDCHGEEDPEAGISLSSFTTFELARKQPVVWEKVLNMLQSGVMPPEDVERPPKAQVEIVAEIIQTEVLKLDCTGKINPGRVTVRRLNRTEYNNTIRDLTGLDVSPADDFPADDVGYGFDNIGDVLSISPIHTEKYLQAAEEIAAAAIVEIRPARVTKEPKELEGGKRFGPVRVLPSNGTIFGKFDVKHAGDYVVIARAYGQQAGDEPVKMQFVLDGKGRNREDVRATREKPGDYTARMRLRPGKREIGVTFTNDFYDEKNKRDRNFYLLSLTLEGPAEPPLESLPESHRRIIVSRPSDHDGRWEPAAEKNLGRFASRAFRRRISDEELKRLLALVDRAKKRGETFQSAMRLGVQAVLSSPNFLFRIERDPDKKAERISEFELASRLSYFLWSSTPDVELLKLADQGKLRDQLQSQVSRMLNDPKSDALVENFAGQWLQIRNLEEIAPDPKVFPQFDEKLRDAMRKETELFFASVMRENRSVLEFLDSDFTFLNARLAKLYGIPGPKGDQFERVSLKNSQRGGVLTQASILTITSNPNRTSPVKRGKWILEQILGTPPPPPPPDVPELEETPEAVATGSLRQRLEIHRAKPICASCHNRMDPMGFAMENYNAIGAWRDRDGKFPIDPSGELPDGRTFKNSAELKRALKDKPAPFCRSLCEKMLTYALGRGLDYYDRCAVEDVYKELVQHEYRFAYLIWGIVKSDPFQMRGVEGTNQ